MVCVLLFGSTRYARSPLNFSNSRCRWIMYNSWCLLLMWDHNFPPFFTHVQLPVCRWIWWRKSSCISRTENVGKQVTIGSMSSKGERHINVLKNEALEFHDQNKKFNTRTELHLPIQTLIGTIILIVLRKLYTLLSSLLLWTQIN